MADATPLPQASLPNVVDWREFLTDYPPGTRGSVEGAVEEVSTDGRPKVARPELQLHCDGDCRGISYCAGDIRASGLLFPCATWQPGWDVILYYYCRKCQTAVKSYAVRVLGDESTLRSTRYPEVGKLGEWPTFSFLTPSRVTSLVGPDRDLFFKGRRSECEGLGVGAFAYYRRIVEGQKSRLLDEIIRVGRRTGGSDEAVSRLEKARAENQFSKAVGLVKDAIPQSLFIRGQNPLILLHAALSRDLHEASDEECLRMAHDVRVVLFELAERLGQALKDEQELTDAVTRLLHPEP